MDNQIFFREVYGKAPRAGRKFGCINVDVDTLAADLDPGLGPIRNMELADISWRVVLPRILSFFEKTGIKATFFLIGKHLELPSCRECVKKIVGSGHELGNHTMNHKKQFSLLPEAEMEKEIRQCHERLAEVGGEAPVGFRAPGYTITRTVIKILHSLGYKYDSSLNLSRFYSLVKWIYKHFLIKDKTYLTLQNFRGFPRRDRVYWVVKEEGVDEERPFLLFPINIIPFVHYPFVSATLMNFGLEPSKLAYRIVKRKVDVLNFELHDIEFVRAQDLSGTGMGVPYLARRYAKSAIEERERYFGELFKLFRSDFEMMTFSEIAGRLGEEKSAVQH